MFSKRYSRFDCKHQPNTTKNSSVYGDYFGPFSMADLTEVNHHRDRRSRGRNFSSTCTCSCTCLSTSSMKDKEFYTMQSPCCVNFSQTNIYMYNHRKDFGDLYSVSQVSPRSKKSNIKQVKDFDDNRSLHITDLLPLDYDEDNSHKTSTKRENRQVINDAVTSPNYSNTCSILDPTCWILRHQA